jgi:plasmid stabilization system protein ParE
MDWQVVFSPRSLRDLQNIVEFITGDNPLAADNVALSLFEKSELLGKSPKIGPTLPQRPNARFFPVGSYLIIYRLDEKNQVVRILRFWHAARGTRPIR